MSEGEEGVTPKKIFYQELDNIQKAFDPSHNKGDCILGL